MYYIDPKIVESTPGAGDLIRGCWWFWVLGLKVGFFGVFEGKFWGDSNDYINI